MASNRRLAAILAADAVGYSRLMRADEDGTHERIKAHRRELLDPKIHEHNGRIVKFTGDGMLVEFASVVEAVLCAVEMQCGMWHRNAALADEERLDFRIGVNLSDVIVEPEDIFGDGVNIAARLEALAEPNGVCVSQVVYEQVRDKLSYPFEDLGHRVVKNITRPLHVFALGAKTIAGLPAPTVSTAQPDARAALSAVRPGAPRLSIVVLPFADLNPGTDQQYLADAVTDDVTTDLSRIKDMTVISRNTAFTYSDRPIDTKQIGRELNVRYVLQGSVRHSGRRMRVNAQLIDAETDAHVWADRFDHETDDLFALQDQVTRRMAVALDLQLVAAEAARRADHSDAFDHVLRGRAALNRGCSRESFGEAIERFERALFLDPASTKAHAFLAHALSSRVLEQMSNSAAADLWRAEELIAPPTVAAEERALGHFIKGQILRSRRQFAAAVPEYEAALALDRNSVLALAALGQCKFLAGAIDEAIPAQEQAIRLSPRDPYVGNWYWRIGMVHLLQSDAEEAIRWLERARIENPRVPGPHAWLAAAYGVVGDMQGAADELDEARRLSGDGRYSSIRRFKGENFWAPKVRVLADNTFLAGLRKAGVPEV